MPVLRRPVEPAGVDRKSPWSTKPARTTRGRRRSRCCKQRAAAISRKRFELHEVACHGEPNLPPYRPIKAPGRTPLGEDAMKLQKILFSFDGRIGRRTYWLAILALIAAVQVLTFAPFL